MVFLQFCTITLTKSHEIFISFVMRNSANVIGKFHERQKKLGNVSRNFVSQRFAGLDIKKVLYFYFQDIMEDVTTLIIFSFLINQFFPDPIDMSRKDLNFFLNICGLFSLMYFQCFHYREVD